MHLVILFLVIAMVIVIFILLYKEMSIYRLTSASTPQKSIQESNNSVNLTKCAMYGTSQNKDNLYIKYIVQPGDTLLLIAQKKLGSSSRVGDIVYINKDAYPGLSIQSPFIEQGWILYLPPSYVKQIEVVGNNFPELLYAASGELVSTTPDGKWTIVLNSLNPKFGLNISSDTQFINKAKTAYQDGDCLRAVVQGEGQKVYAVFPQ